MGQLSISYFYYQRPPLTKGPLRGIWSYHFVHNRIEYRIAYRILEYKKEIEVVLVKSRENFYQTLKRVMKR